MIEITLLPDDEILAADVGFRRRRNAVARGLRSRHANSSSFWGSDIEAACAELAAAIALGVPWTGQSYIIGETAEPVADIGERTEVRLSQGRAPMLTFDANRDHDDRIYLLVAGVAPAFVIHGWMLGIDCRRDEWRVVYLERKVFRVPPAALHPVDARVAA